MSVIRETIIKRAEMLGITQKEFAEHTGTTASQTNMFWKGISTLGQNKLDEAFKTLEIDISKYSNRNELAQKTAAILISKGYTAGQAKRFRQSELASIVGEPAIKTFFNIDSQLIDELITSPYVDFESTFIFFKAMVVQIMAANGKTTKLTYQNSWKELIPASLVVAGLGLALFPIAGIGIAAASILAGAKLFGKSTILAPFYLLAKNMIQK